MHCGIVIHAHIALEWFLFCMDIEFMVKYSILFAETFHDGDSVTSATIEERRESGERCTETSSKGVI